MHNDDYNQNRPQRPMFDQFAGRAEGDKPSPSAARGQPPQREGARQPRPQPRRTAAQRSSANSRRQPQSTAARPRQGGGAAGNRQATARRGSYTRRRRKKGHTVVVVVLLVLAILATLVFAVYNTFVKNIDGTRGEQGELPDEIATLPEYTGKGIINFLVCGIDYDDETASGYATDDHIGRTDMILYVHYDTANNKANILQLPRDIYVGDKVRTGGTYKINSLYYNAEDPNNRMAALATVIHQKFKLPVDFYVTIDMDAVKDLIDNGTGPIEVYVPIDVNDPNTGDTLQAGWRYFTGAEAEFYLRNRYSTTYHDQGDVMRLQMQQYFYSALYREFTQLAPTDLVMWMRVLLHRVKTDMTDIVQLGGLAQKALQLQSSDITFIRPAVSGAYHNGQSLLSLVDDEFAMLLNEYFRPEGESYTVAELGIHTLPVIATMGINEASIRTMGEIQETEADR